MMSEKIVNIHGMNYLVEMNGHQNHPTIICLHGFTGSSTTWREVAKSLSHSFRIVAVDLLGHGRSSSPVDCERYVMDQQIADLDQLFEVLGLQDFILLGYSMGGRIALAYTLRYPQRVSNLVLESASPGLKTEDERVKRRQSDGLLADRILSEGLSSFIDFWQSIPLFHSQKKIPNEVQLAIRTERLGQNAIGLANSLRGMGTGCQPSYWEKMSQINCPVLLITGELDTKFKNISREMQKILIQAHHKSIQGAGHAIHVEKPHEFATMIEEHINDLKK